MTRLKEIDKDSDRARKWNYRLARIAETYDPPEGHKHPNYERGTMFYTYKVVEVHYDDEGLPRGWVDGIHHPVKPEGEDDLEDALESVRWTWEKISLAHDKPVLAISESGQIEGILLDQESSDS